MQLIKQCEECRAKFSTYPSVNKRWCSKRCTDIAKTGARCTPEMFWAKVHKSDGCWIWGGTKHFRGYGACTKAYGDTRAHRVAWKLTNGHIPEGQGVLHRCNTPLCVNPAHLYLGDQKQNMADCTLAGRRNTRYVPVDQLLHPHLSLRGQLTKRPER